ncbi:hypothetical protein [Alkalinema sp. FACHB-956]|uniref:hypothetical protein n=1 Tax=Alkalinema sp. FACHB-956 TaxID=2692768 RepID=UPI00168A25E5|nr:hypothetical protein [Alkalinema sp. FACHB-956]MBD2328248.1 hypothetical protein [Alkalinema sp. FACHB-956]
MSIQLNSEDRQILIQQRLKRFRKQFFHALATCRLQFSRRRECLVIHCPEPWIVDCLLEDVEALAEEARIIVGARVISLYFVGEEVYQASTEPNVPLAS